MMARHDDRSSPTDRFNVFPILLFPIGFFLIGDERGAQSTKASSIPLDQAGATSQKPRKGLVLLNGCYSMLHLLGGPQLDNVGISGPDPSKFLKIGDARADRRATRSALT
jgi:hypothetical protein